MIRPALAAASVVAMGMVGAAYGQQARSAAPSSSPSVTVDLSVLDELGPTASGRDMPAESTPRRAAPTIEPRGRILLTPPSTKPKIQPGGRSVGVPPRRPGPAVRRAPPPVPRTRPRRPVAVAAKPPAKADRTGPIVENRRVKPVTAAIRPATQPKRDPAKTIETKPQIAAKRSTEPNPTPTAGTQAVAPTPEVGVAKEADAAAATLAPAEPTPNPRRVVATDPPMSLLHPPQPATTKKTDPEATAQAERTAPKKGPRASAGSPVRAGMADTKVETRAAAAIIAMTSEPADETDQPTRTAGRASADMTETDAESAVPTAASGQQQAALTTPEPEPLGDGRTVKLAFSDGAALSTTTREKIEQVAARLKTDGRLRLRLMAYADGQSRSTSQARRLSLNRALAVRSHLIKKGVRSARIDVRALGDKFEKGPPDRVDLMIFAR